MYMHTNTQIHTKAYIKNANTNTTGNTQKYKHKDIKKAYTHTHIHTQEEYDDVFYSWFLVFAQNRFTVSAV